MNHRHSNIALRSRIVTQRDNGFSIRAIARDVGVCPSTVIKWIKRWEESGNLNDLARPGAPRKTTPAQDARIMAAAAADPHTTAVAITQGLQLDVGAMTVRRRMHQGGIHHRVPAVKERITDDHRAARLAFAQQYVEQDMEFWGRAVFSDEKVFRSTCHGKRHCWRPNNTRYDRENILEVARSGHVTCNVWGWVSQHGVGDVCQIEGRFTADKYIEILEEFFLPSLRDRNFPFPPGPILFIQDKCSIHTAHIVQRWFEGQNNLQLLQLPSKSPDMNVIEHVWAQMVNTWDTADERTVQQLLAHVKQSWEFYRRRPELARGLVVSMPDRLRAVIQVEGGWTRY